jgi:hypothetical protein
MPRTAAVLALSLAAAGVFAAPKYDYWPNPVSKANSDPWLIQNHKSIRILRPRVMVINFSNNRTPEQARALVDRIIAAVAESSRFRGYRDPKAVAQIQYEVVKLVDLADRPADPRPEGERFEGNSTKYPREPDSARGINFDYSALFSDRFAEYYGFKDPDRPGRFLTLAQLVDRGIVNEVWFTAIQGNFGSPFESVEVKQQYDDKLRKIPGKWVQAGNGGSRKQPWIGRSLRIGFINSDRGPGCFLESLSHSFEGVANSNCIPYFKKYFDEFAMLDMDRTYGLPFKSYYALWGEGKGVEYPDPHTAVVSDGTTKTTLENYVAKGGNVHFMPNGRHHYDLDNRSPVMSTIEGWRERKGPGGKDVAKPWDGSVIERYRETAPDCMGRWLVYWRQNVPGYGNKARDDAGKPMLSWWPFLFY